MKRTPQIREATASRARQRSRHSVPLAMPTAQGTTSHATLVMPWDVVTVDDPLESAEAAAARLGLKMWTLKSRARVRGLTSGATSGRPRKGVVVGMLRSVWDQCATTRRRGRPAAIKQPEPPRVAQGIAWTAAEDAILRERTTPPPRGRLRIHWPSLLRALPRRGKAGIESHRAELGLTRKPPPWQPRELKILARKFGKVSRTTLMAMLDTRSWDAIIKQAKADGLVGLPEGKLLLSAAAEKFGYHVSTFRDLLLRHRVKIVLYSCCDGLERAASPWRYVSEAACHRAVKADASMETMAQAAERLGVPYKTLRAWLLAAGRVLPGRRGCWQRLEPGVADTIAAANGFRAGGETLEQAAKRVRADPRNLSAWLAAAGVARSLARGQRMWLDPARVDEVVRLRRKKEE